MRRSYVNALLVVGAFLGYFALGQMTGRATYNGGPPTWEGPAYIAMVTDHDVTRGSASTRMVPAFPLLAVVGYAITDDVVGSFVFVNLVALSLLVLAACLILDAMSSPLAVKLCAAFTLVVLGLPSAMAAFNPIQPDLVAVALVTLAVAACAATETTVPGSAPRSRPPNVFRGPLTGKAVLGVLQVGATLASPVGIVAPLYGIWRSWRLRQRDVLALGVFLPALFAWAVVQFWARGGAAGLVDLVRPSRVAADAALWRESAFIMFGLYFMLTCMGGLTMMLWSSPRSISMALRDNPEVFALLLPVLLFIATAGLDVPRAIPLLLPFWLIVLGSWARRYPGTLAWPLALAVGFTIVTQRPGTKMDDVRYFVDWFPYSVHAGRATVVFPALWSTWTTRLWVVAAGLAAFVALRRVSLEGGNEDGIDVAARA